jgi:Reverse transcriptase (RNA-dependent DNA polymerase)
MNNILVIDNDISVLNEIKSSLKKMFSMKDLDEIVYIFDIKIYRDISKRLIKLSQSIYINNVLKMFNIQDVQYFNYSYDYGYNYIIIILKL